MNTSEPTPSPSSAPATDSPVGAPSPGSAATPAAPAPEPRARRPRTGPIVWGSLMLLFCAYVVQQTVAPGSIDALTWAIASVIGLGVLLLLVGLAVIVRSARGPRR